MTFILDDVPGVRYHDCPDCGDHLPSGDVCQCGAIWTDGLGALGCGTMPPGAPAQTVINAQRRLRMMNEGQKLVWEWGNRWGWEGAEPRSR